MTDCGFISNIEDTLKNRDPQSRLSELALAILEFEVENIKPENALCQRGLSDENDAVKEITDICQDLVSYTNSLVRKADDQLKEYEDEEKQSNHRQRRQRLENIIRILQPIEENTKDVGFLTLLARVYLHRALLYRPKGRTTPARKTEAIRKAMALSDKAMSGQSPKNELTEAFRIWAYTALELEKADTAFKTPLHKLKKAVSYISKNKVADLNDAIVIMTYMERSNNYEKYKAYLNSFFKRSEKKYQKKQADFFLLKARFSFLSNLSETSSSEINEYLRKAIDNAPKAFAAPFWDDLIDFLKKLTWDESEKKIKNDKWKSLILSAYRKCRDIESRTTNNIFLRWYWSRQKDLYDLAFLAADSLEKKAKIADSLKSRPTLLYQSLNDLRGQIDDIETILDRENESRDGRYLKSPSSPERESESEGKQSSKNPDSSKKKKKSKEKRSSKSPGSEKKEEIIAKKKFSFPFEKLPVPWIAIHFYLNELEGKGYALIFNSNSEDDDKWKERRFNYHELHRKFLAWQELYLLSGKDASDSLVELCRTIGDTMPFFFDKDVISEKSNSVKNSSWLTTPINYIKDKIGLSKILTPSQKSKILWIPHGFLHRLPLHAAIDSTDKVFLEHHVSRYIPAWHLLTDNHSNQEKNTQDKNRYLITRFESDFSKLKEMEWNNKEDNKVSLAIDKDLKACMTQNPEILMLLCHGHGDILNPFKSWLDFGESKITVLDILDPLNKTNLSGTMVFLGACESDMAPPTEHTIDEHLSLSTVFMSHHTKEIIAGLWKVQTNRVDDCYSNIIGPKQHVGIALLLNDWQIKQIEKWREKKNNNLFYLLAPFRVMGFPHINASDKLKGDNQ